MRDRLEDVSHTTKEICQRGQEKRLGGHRRSMLNRTSISAEKITASDYRHGPKDNRQERLKIASTTLQIPNVFHSFKCQSLRLGYWKTLNAATQQDAHHNGCKCGPYLHHSATIFKGEGRRGPTFTVHWTGRLRTASRPIQETSVPSQLLSRSNLNMEQ